VVELYIPPPELSTEDVSITLVETVYRRADVVSIRGTLLSPVWPVIIFNNHMIGDINLSESNVSVSRSSSRADDETTYDLYEFTAENITLNTEGDPLVATVYTDVDGNLMRIAPETSLLVQQGGDNGADNNGDTSGLALGASWGCAFHTNATGHFYDCWTLLILVAALYGVKKFRFSG
jgi:hypothetical protein